MSQGHILGPKQSQSQAARQLQDLTVSQSQALDQRVIQALAQNPALELDEEPIFDEDVLTEDPEGWNPDFDRPEDEWETGDGRSDWPEEDQAFPDFTLTLERAAEAHCGEDPACLKRALKAIDAFTQTGRLPEDADDWLSETLADLRKSDPESEPLPSSPTFEVNVVNDKVTAFVTAGMIDFVRIKPSVTRFSQDTQKFMAQKRDRSLVLNGIAHHVLEDIQSDFFRQGDLKSALLTLLPLPTKEIQKLGISSPLKLDKPYFSKLGDLSVACDFGVFPLSLFWPEKAAIVRVWVRSALEAGHTDTKVIRSWITQKTNERLQALPSSDRQRPLLEPLSRCTRDDVRNALKQVRRS